MRHGAFAHLAAAVRGTNIVRRLAAIGETIHDGVEGRDQDVVAAFEVTIQRRARHTDRGRYARHARSLDAVFRDETQGLPGDLRLPVASPHPCHCAGLQQDSSAGLLHRPRRSTWARETLLTRPVVGYGPLTMLHRRNSAAQATGRRPTAADDGIFGGASKLLGRVFDVPEEEPTGRGRKARCLSACPSRRSEDSIRRPLAQTDLHHGAHQRTDLVAQKRFRLDLEHERPSRFWSTSRARPTDESTCVPSRSG